MAKVAQLFTLDPDVVAMGKASGANMSALVNDFLRRHFTSQGFDDPAAEKAKLEAELLEQRKTAAEIETRLRQIDSQEALRKKMQTDQQIKEGEEVYGTYKASGHFPEISEDN